MTPKLTSVPKLSDVRLRPGLFLDRFELNRSYVLSLENRNLLQNFFLEAGLIQIQLHETKRNRNYDPLKKSKGSSDIHWGWESPGCELRGHFLGHWLSAAARIVASTNDQEVKAKADAVVAGLASCQAANGGEWVASIPTLYLDRIAAGKRVWAPHYTIHKTLMGLFDMYRYGGSEESLEILVGAAEWFFRWSGQFSKEAFDEILDVETGGMLEVWADLYGVTQERKHLELIHRYTRSRLFEPLLEGKDVLTNRHANTTIPEIHGAARAFEVTGEEKWRKIVEAYWRSAVVQRGYFCTGGQTCGEIWTPPFRFSARLGDTNQEHCVVYNMIRLADWLYRWTGEPEYADYIERNTYNGILAQQNPDTGMVAYFLPLEPGARKIWGSPTNDFWCCHGSLVQAHTTHNAYIYYQKDDELLVSQYLPSELQWNQNGTSVSLSMDLAESLGRADIKSAYAATSDSWHRPNELRYELRVHADRPTEFSLNLRIPSWISAPASIQVDGGQPLTANASGVARLHQRWTENRIEVVFPKSLRTEPLPDRAGYYAIMDGPLVLAGIGGDERVISGDPADAGSFLVADNEREWWHWQNTYRTVNQPECTRFVPLFEIRDEPYTVYFPIRNSSQ